MSDAIQVSKNAIDYNVVDQPYVHVKVAPRLNGQISLHIPSNAKPSAHGSIAVVPHDDGSGDRSAPCKGLVTLTDNPEDFTSGHYGNIDYDFRIQIAPATPQPDGVMKNFIMEPGKTYYINVTLAHDGKVGGANQGPVTVAAFLRVPQ